MQKPGDQRSLELFNIYHFGRAEGHDCLINF